MTVFKENFKHLLYFFADLFLFVFLAGAVALLVGRLVELSGLDIASYFEDQKINPYEGLVFEYLPLLFSILIALFVSLRVFKRPFKSAGFIFDNFFSEFSKGIFLALVLLCFGFILLKLFGLILIVDIHWNGSLFFGFFLFFLVQSSVEEIVARSYLIPAIESRSNTWIALVVSSLVFSIVHGSNPNVSLISMINIFLAGMLLGLLFIKYRSIWVPIGFHAGWNFLQGSFFGFEVSGHEVYSLINSKETGNDILTGGSFGFEASILCSIFLVLSFVIILRKSSILNLTTPIDALNNTNLNN